MYDYVLKILCLEKAKMDKKADLTLNPSPSTLN